MKLTRFIVAMLLVTVINLLLIILCVHDIVVTSAIDVTTIELYKLKSATIYSNVAQLIFFIFLLYTNIDIIYKKYKVDKAKKSLDAALDELKEMFRKANIKVREVTTDDVKDDTSVRDWAEPYMKNNAIKSEDELKEVYPLTFEPIGKAEDIVSDCDAVDNQNGKISKERCITITKRNRGIKHPEDDIK